MTGDHPRIRRRPRLRHRPTTRRRRELLPELLLGAVVALDIEAQLVAMNESIAPMLETW